MPAKIVDRNEKKGQILEAALMVFAKKGFSKSTISDIANAAGIGKGTVYEYFSNKEEIINCAFREFMRSLEPDFREILLMKIPASEKFKLIMKGFTRFMNTGAVELVELVFEFWSEGIKQNESRGMLYREMKNFYFSFREIFADIIIEGMGDGSFRKDINPHAVASVLIGALDGALVQWFLDKQAIDYSLIVRTLTDTILQGISANKG